MLHQLQSARDNILILNVSVAVTGLVGCLDSYQSSVQVWYLVFQMAMLPMVLVAAYIGWVMPDIYIEKVTQSQSQSIDSFLSSLESDVQKFSNPLQDEEAGDRDRSTISDASEAQKTDRHERQTSKEDDIAEGLRQAKQVGKAPLVASLTCLKLQSIRVLYYLELPSSIG